MRGAAKEVAPAVVGGDLLIGSGAGTEEVAQLVRDRSVERRLKPSQSACDDGRIGDPVIEDDADVECGLAD